MLGMRHIVSGFVREEKTPISVQHAIASEWSTLMSGGAGGFDTPLHILYDGRFYFPNRYPKRGSSADALSTRTDSRMVCVIVVWCGVVWRGVVWCGVAWQHEFTTALSQGLALRAAFRTQS